MPTLTTLGLLAMIGSNTANAAESDLDYMFSDDATEQVGFAAEPGKEFRHTPVRGSSSRPGSHQRPTHSPSRSSHPVRRSTHNSSTRTVVRTSSHRPVAVPATSRPPNAPVRVVQYRPSYRTVRPYHGVFVYGPRPVYHKHYHVTQTNTVKEEVKTEHLPTRSLNRADTLAVGLRTGSYYSAYEGANGYADVGLGLTARYRPAESVGLELAISRHADDWDSSAERDHTVTQGSVMLFASPWSRISPYALVGVSHTGRSINDEILDRNTDSVTTVSTGAPLYGLHGGLGVEFAVGKNLAFDLEGRYIGYASDTTQDDLAVNGAFTTTAGFLIHF